MTPQEEFRGGPTCRKPSFIEWNQVPQSL
jgi:hypothetical protein